MLSFFLHSSIEMSTNKLNKKPIKNAKIEGSFMQRLKRRQFQNRYSYSRKIESRGYGVMYSPLYLPELKPIEQFWAFVKGKMKRPRLTHEENLSQGTAEACNNIRLSNLQGFFRHPKR